MKGLPMYVLIEALIMSEERSVSEVGMYANE